MNLAEEQETSSSLQNQMEICEKEQFLLSEVREVSFFIGRGGGLWKFSKFCEFLVIPPTV